MSEVQALEGSKIRDLRLMEESSRDKKQQRGERWKCLWQRGRVACGRKGTTRRREIRREKRWGIGSS